MAFYRKKPWHLAEVGITFYKQRPYIVHLGRWEWKSGPAPEPGNSLFGILCGEEPSEGFKRQLPLLRRLVQTAEELFSPTEGGEQ